MFIRFLQIASNEATMKIKFTQALGLPVLFFLNASLADDNGLANSTVQHKLSLATALQAAQVSVTTCRKQNLNISAAVVDSSGLLQVLLRDTNASPVSVSLSQSKAFTAANFLKDTTQLADLSDTAVGRSKGILMSAGGVLIKVDDVVYGAIGVSGAATGAKDDECARAGLTAIAKSLAKPVDEKNKETEEAK